MDDYLTNPVVFIVITIVSFLQFMFILRFLFEIMRVNYHNPVCQFVVRVTNPIIAPLRIIPLSVGRFDIIIISLLVLITAFKIYFPFYFTSFDYSINSLLIASFGKAIQEVLDVLWYAVIIGAIGSWFVAYNGHPIFILIDELCEPLYRPIRKTIPSVSGIDFSPIILLVLINLLQMIIVPPIFNLSRYF